MVSPTRWPFHQVVSQSSTALNSMRNGVPAHAAGIVTRRRNQTVPSCVPHCSGNGAGTCTSRHALSSKVPDCQPCLTPSSARSKDARHSSTRRCSRAACAAASLARSCNRATCSTNSPEPCNASALIHDSMGVPPQSAAMIPMGTWVSSWTRRAKYHAVALKVRMLSGVALLHVPLTLRRGASATAFSTVYTRTSGEEARVNSSSQFVTPLYPSCMYPTGISMLDCPEAIHTSPRYTSVSMYSLVLPRTTISCGPSPAAQSVRSSKAKRPSGVPVT